MKKLLKLIIFILIILVCIYVYKEYDIKNKVLKKFYPIKYKEYIEKYADEYTGNRRITVYTESETHCIKGSLSEVFSLINSESFTSPHKSFIVNMEHIDKLTGFTLFTTNGIEVPIAQKKLKEFQNEFSRFIKNYIKQG